METKKLIEELKRLVKESVDEEDDLGLFIQTTGSLYKKYLEKQIEDDTKIAWDKLVDEGAKLYKKEIENKKFTKEELASAKAYIQDYYASELSDEQIKDTGRKYQALTVKTKKNESFSLKENRYATEEDMYNGDVTEDEYLDSFEYIYSQKLNGNIADYRSKLIDLQISGDLGDYISYCEEAGCDPEVERYLDNRDAEPTEDDDYEYIYSSLVNGNITQYKKLLRNLQSKGQLNKYKAYCSEMGVDPEIGRWL